jgi:hypothetical protein
MTAGAPAPAKGRRIIRTVTLDGIRLTSCDPTLAEQMDMAERSMRQDRNVLHKAASTRRVSPHGCIHASSQPLAGKCTRRGRDTHVEGIATQAKPRQVLPLQRHRRI